MIFKNINAIILSGMNMTKKQCEILTNLFIKYDGNVVKDYSNISKLIKNSKQLYICCAKKMKADDIYKIDNWKSIPKYVDIIDHTWISDCIQNSKLLSIDKYKIKLEKKSNNKRPPLINNAKTLNTLTSYFQSDSENKQMNCNDDNYNIIWKYNNNNKPWLLDMCHKDLPLSNKIASFDLDGTIIVTKSGNTFAKTWEDWCFLNDNVPQRLQLLHNNGYRIVVFTNQGGMARGRIKKDDLVKKLLSIQKAINIPIHFFAATLDKRQDANTFRKPATGMWFSHLDHLKNMEVNMDDSFYVGDAVDKRTSFSDSDRVFAANLQLSFYEPREIFICKQLPQNASSNMKKIWKCFENHIDTDEPQPKRRKLNSKISANINTLEMVVLIGSPASGKTTIYEEYFAPHNYAHINQDKLGSKSKCFKKTEEALANNQSVVVDNTNPTVEKRLEFINRAKKYNAKVRCIHLTTPIEIAKVRNTVRYQSGGRKVPVVAMYTYFKRLEPPQVDEFDEIIKI